MICGRAAAFAVWIAAAGASELALAQLTVRETPGSIAVSHEAVPAWRIRFDLRQGGVATTLHLAGGPNLASDQGGFSGLFNLFACDIRKGDPKASPDGGTAKALIKNKGTVESARVLERASGRIAVEIRGGSTGWYMRGPQGERVLDYRQTFTFEPRRITCDGEAAWVYGYGTKPVELSVLNYFAKDSVVYPVRIAGADGYWRELPLAWSMGTAFPTDLRHPVTAEIWFRDGERLLIRSVKVPPIWNDCPWYKYERPWQTGWMTLFGFTSTTERCGTRFPVGQPIAYRYEMEFPAEPARNTPPVVRVTRPARDAVSDMQDADVYSGLRFKPGDSILFEASAKDREDGALTGPAVAWTVYQRGFQVFTTGTGTSFRFRVPEVNNELWWIAAAATDSRGLRGIDYITFKAADGLK